MTGHLPKPKLVSWTHGSTIPSHLLSMTMSVFSLFLSLSLSLTHTHTHSLSLSLSLTLPPSLGGGGGGGGKGKMIMEDNCCHLKRPSSLQQLQTNREVFDPVSKIAAQGDNDMLL